MLFDKPSHAKKEWLGAAQAPPGTIFYGEEQDASVSRVL